MMAQVALCLLLGTGASADFYRYVGKDGVEVFTNSPPGATAVRVMREGSSRKEPRRDGKARRSVTGEARSGSNEAAPGATEPLLPVKGVVTSNCGWRRDPIDGGIKHHNGVDIAVPVGTRVKAIASGTVTESGSHGGYGNLVTIDHGNGMVSLYGHNSQLDVRVGEQVQAGQTVALSGSTGRSTGPHLHFELWRNGVNVTEAYLSNGAGIPEVSGGIRTYLHKNGSIVFTNLR
jgi:murein DD-endopeptidase MepM/ murein hydrolase activator NlpD